MDLEINNLLINSVPDGIIAFNTDLQVTAWNAKMKHFFQLPSEAVIGHKITEPCIPVLLRENFHTFFHEALQGNSSTISTINFQHNDSYGFYEITYFQLLHEDGSIAGG